MSNWWNDYTHGYINRIPGTQGGNVRIREETTAQQALRGLTPRPSAAVQQEPQLRAADVMSPEDYRRWSEERQRKLAQKVKQEWQSFLRKRGIKDEAALSASQLEHLKWLFHYHDSAVGWSRVFSLAAGIVVFFSVHLSVSMALAVSALAFFAVTLILLRPLLLPFVTMIWALHMGFVALGHFIEFICKIVGFVLRVVLRLIAAAMILAAIWFVGLAIYSALTHH
jgi:hypothetical protein